MSNKANKESGMIDNSNEKAQRYTGSQQTAKDARDQGVGITTDSNKEHGEFVSIKKNVTGDQSDLRPRDQAEVRQNLQQ